MTEETAILEEFTERKPRKGKLFDALIASSVSYIAFIIVFFFLAMKTREFSLRTSRWQLLFLILILPLSGTVFLIIGKKIGWIVNCFYFSLTTLALFYSLIRILVEEKNISLEKEWRGYLILGLALSSTVLLLSKPIRKYFRVSTMLLITVTAISAILVTVMALTVLRD